VFSSVFVVSCSTSSVFVVSCSTCALMKCQWVIILQVLLN